MIQFHSFYWDNIPKEFVNAHKRVMDHFEIPIIYHTNQDHGTAINEVMINTTDDYIGFFDIDCIPLSKEKVEEWIQYVIDNDTFIGPAQASNHIHPKSHIFAAPSFFIISRKAWERMQKPTFQQGEKWDVAEYVSYVAEHLGQRYRALYPDCFEREPIEGIWYLNNYGFYGIGTVFENTVYHLFQGRFPNNQQLFIQRCNEIINGTFSTEGFYNSKITNYKGKIVR